MRHVIGVVVDEQGTVTGWSSDAERLLGHKANEVVGRRASDLLAPEVGHSPFWTLPPGQDHWHGNLSVLRRDASRVRLRGRGWRFRERDGSSRWWLMASDEESCLPQETGLALFDWLFNRSSVAVIVFDANMRCLWQNAAMSRITGIAEENFRGRRMAEIISGSDADVWERCMRQVITTGESLFESEVHGQVPADPGRDHVLAAEISPLKNPHGDILGICVTLFDVTERHRAYNGLKLLNKASSRIGSTLDVMRTAQELADVIVPDLADLVSIDLLETLLNGDEPGPFTGAVTLRRVANKFALEIPPEMTHEPGDVDVYPAASPPVRCMATGRSVMLRLADAEVRSWLSEDPERGKRFEAYGFQFIMGIPVRARGMTLGVAMLYKRTAEPFTEGDRLLVEELVARAAVCLDNARRFARERTAALALQQSLLPQEVPTQAGIKTAWRYLPAGGRSGLGGDWFDVIPLSGARVGLVVGDVVGRGIPAAATMGRLRTAVRTLSDIDLPPDELLTHLDDLVTRFAAERERSETDAADLGATCLYGIYDPVSRKFSMSRAGHPPPAVVTPDGAVEFLDLAAGPPLGLGYLPFEFAEVTLSEGSLLVLFTDGLVDSHTNEDGYEVLQRVLARPASSPEALCDSVLQELLPAQVLDDVALLVARTRALNPNQVAILDVPSDQTAVAEARAWAARQLSAWGLETASFVTGLVVSELVTNAIKYASEPIQLRLMWDDKLICEVSDSSNTAPHMRRARLFDEGGRGLLLVAQLTQRWGTRHTKDGKTIWCEQLDPQGGLS
ncbi:SpoIIE family protein phosphatase [Streptomyces albiflaviniger]|nr:SpoIIE family protein phosphatase [Streptomyces albiflaviniger]